MILVDDRIGSNDLCAQLRRLGVDAELTHLEFGDLAFEGKGANGTSIDIGIELKKLPDLVGSIKTGRLSGHQLPGMTGPTGAYHHSWLLIEGQYRVDRSGQMVVYRGKSLGWRPLPTGALASEMEKRVLTFELCGGCHVHYANNRDDTLRFIQTLYRWFTDKAMDEHTSHLTTHKPFGFLPISDFRDTVSRFPGIGLRTSLAVEMHFGGSLRRAVNAAVDEWAAITTLDKQGRSRRLGIKSAERIVDFCRGTS